MEKDSQNHQDKVSTIFAYGTLMRCEERFDLVKKFNPVSIILAETHGRLYDLGDYPGLVRTSGSREQVQGELIHFPFIEDALKFLDRIEGYHPSRPDDSLYLRKLVDVHVGDGRVRQAWTYVYNQQLTEDRFIPSGDWRQHKGYKEEFLKRLVEKHIVGYSEAQLASELSSTWDPWALVGRSPVPAQTLSDLYKAVSSGLLSERKLSQVTKKWAVVPELETL